MDTEKRQIHNFGEGDLFDRNYQLLEHVGSGGFADVWRAQDNLVGTIVALKIYARLDKEGISKLAKEYKETQSIKHPNLLTGNHFDKNGNIPYLEMYYCEGGDLSRHVGKMKDDELRHMLHDILSGLVYLHQEGIVHQDIKPENILYDTKHKRYMLADFGISDKSRSKLSQSVKQSEMFVSMTESYAPPEKFTGNLADLVPDPKGDIFSLGLTLYELAVGQLPFIPPMATGREMHRQHGQLKLDYSPIKDSKLRQIVEKCTQYRKEARPTAEEVLTILDSKEPEQKPETEKEKGGRHNTVTLEVTDGEQKPPKPPEPNVFTHLRKWLPYIAIVAVVALAAALLIPQISKPNNEEYEVIDTPAIEEMIEDTIWELEGVAEEVEVVEEDETSKKEVSSVRMDGDDIVFTLDGTNYRYKMIWVSGGTFNMGAQKEDPYSDNYDADASDNEGPVHSVNVMGFYMGQTEVTQALWEVVMGNNPSEWRGNNLPVENVSYNDVTDFIRKLNSMTGKSFRLPTEEEWEYAARGGNKSRGYRYSGSNNFAEVAWIGDLGDQTLPVKQKQDNELGLYDMSGNVWEWCSSRWSSNYNSDRTGSRRVYRGGDFFAEPWDCRVSSRFGNTPSTSSMTLGFRLSR